MDAAAKKEILGLIFKRIIIEKVRNARVGARISPVFFEPFGKIHLNSSFLLKEGEKCNGISSKLTDALWVDVYHKLKPILEVVFKGLF